MFFNKLFVFYALTGEDKRIKEFYQSRGLERVIQPAGDGKSFILSLIVSVKELYSFLHYLCSVIKMKGSHKKVNLMVWTCRRI